MSEAESGKVNEASGETSLEPDPSKKEEIGEVGLDDGSEDDENYATPTEDNFENEEDDDKESRGKALHSNNAAEDEMVEKIENLNEEAAPDINIEEKTSVESGDSVQENAVDAEGGGDASEDNNEDVDTKDEESIEVTTASEITDNSGVEKAGEGNLDDDTEKDEQNVTENIQTPKENTDVEQSKGDESGDEKKEDAGNGNEEMQDKITEEEEEGSEEEEIGEQDRQEEKSGDDQNDGGEVQADFAGQGNSQEDVVQVADAEDLDEWKVTFDKFISISCWISLLGSYGVGLILTV